MSEALKPAVVCEPTKDGILLADRLKTGEFKRVLMLFYHGVGDTVMFLSPFRALCKAFPDIYFELGLPLGLTHEQVIPDDIPYRAIDGAFFNERAPELPFDLVVRTLFPMSEGQIQLTKGEFCCVHELGIPPVWGHGPIAKGVNRLVAVHFQITCLPDSCNPDEATAERIWNDILAAGYIPIECHFQHVFHNPVNKKFPFVDATVRRCRPQTSSLVGLLRGCAAFVGVVSGPVHVALAALPPERVFLLEKDFTREMFTKNDIAHANLRDYKGEVKAWLLKIEGATFEK